MFSFSSYLKDLYDKEIDVVEKKAVLYLQKYQKDFEVFLNGEKNDMLKDGEKILKEQCIKILRAAIPIVIVISLLILLCVVLISVFWVDVRNLLLETDVLLR